MRWFIPPVLTVSCLALMVLLHLTLPVATVFPATLRPAGIGLLTLGFLLIATTGMQLLRHDTAIHTFGRPRKLLMGGTFAYSRNPIYLGFLLSLLGGWVYLGSATPVVGPLLFYAVASRWYISFEEARLGDSFGADYAAYQERVGRWIYFIGRERSAD